MHLVAQPVFGADAEAVAHDQHADHQLGINGGPADAAVVGPEVFAHSGQVDKAINRAKKMIHRHVTIEVEAVEECLLQPRPLAIIARSSVDRGLWNQAIPSRLNGFFHHYRRTAAIRLSRPHTRRPTKSDLGVCGHARLKHPSAFFTKGTMGARYLMKADGH